MTEPATETLFLRYRQTGDPQALAAVFDHLAPQMLLVAAHLAGGGLAEDLVQATFLDAIRHRERWDASRPLAPWLVGLLSNHVREARRQRRRVPDPQRLEARDSERPDDVAEANECIAAVHAAVEQLPRHYRQVLSLRLVHGLEQQQIGSSLGVPLGTVKVRLHRGLALLRRALPAGFASAFAVLLSPGRGLAAVRQVVLGEAGVAAGAAAATAGILIGGWMMKQVVIAAAVVVAAVGAWFAVDAALAAPAPLEVANGSPAAPAAARVDGSPVPAQEPAAVPHVPVHEATASRVAAPTTGGLAVQVAWASDGTPAGEVEVFVYSSEERERAVKGRAPLRGIERRTSDVAGRLQFDDLAPGAYFCRAMRAQTISPSTATVTVVAGVVSQTRLDIGGDVRLRVTVVDDAAQPQSGADVWCNDSYAAGERVRCLGITDRVGGFRYRGLPLSSVWARQSGRQPSATHDLPPWRAEDVPSEEVEVRLAIGTAGCSLLGTVVDPNGRPVSAARVLIACDDAIVTASKRMALLVTTDEAGRFTCDEVPPGERTIVADAPGLAPAVARITTSPQEPTTAVLALRVGATLSGRVTDDAGLPVAGVNVTAGLRAVAWGIRLPWGSERTVRTGADGCYRLEALCPGSSKASVQVEPEAVRQFEFADGQQLTWDVTKEADRSIAGIVVDAQDKPLPRWRVRVLGLAKADMTMEDMQERSADTDGAGRFKIRGLRDTDYRVFVFAEVAVGQDAWRAAGMVPRAVLDRVRPSPTELVVRIDAAAMASGWIEGSIAMPEGVTAKSELSLYAKVLRGGAFSVPQERLEPGTTTFRLGPLPAGEYDLLCDIEGRGRLAQNGLQLAPGATLRLPPFAADAQQPLRLALRHADGRPVLGAAVKLRSTHEPCRETKPGHYESLPVAPGQYELVVRGPDFAPGSFQVDFTGQQEPFVHTVTAGTAVQLCFKPATPRDRWVGGMQIWLHDAQGTELVHEMTQIDGKQDFVWPIGLLPGTYTVKVFTFGEGHVTTTFEVAATPLRVDLQLAK